MSGNEERARPTDRRARRTRAALIGAFNHLVLHRRQRRIRVADIVAEADVGRSTFYEHYRGADDIHMDALAPLFAILADAAAGHGDPVRVERLLGHFWDNRQRARESFNSRLGEKAMRLLAAQIEERLGDADLLIPRRLAALQLAEATLAPIRGWLTGEAPCTPAALATGLCRSGARLTESLGDERRPTGSDQAGGG